MPGRPLKENLSFFKVDVNLLQDRKIVQLREAHPDKGLEVLLILWAKIYGGRGYFIEWNDRQEKDLYHVCKTSKEKLKLIVSTCLEENIFHQGMYMRHGILTSQAIMTNFLYGKNSSRQINIIEEYSLVDKDFPETHDLDNIRKKVYYLRFPNIDLIKDELGFLVSGWKNLVSEKFLVWPPVTAASSTPQAKVNKSIVEEICDYPRGLNGRILPPPYGSPFDFEWQKAIIFDDFEWKDRMGDKFGLVKTEEGIRKTDMAKVDSELARFFEHVVDTKAEAVSFDMQKHFNNWYPLQGRKRFPEKTGKTDLHISDREQPLKEMLKTNRYFS